MTVEWSVKDTFHDVEVRFRRPSQLWALKSGQVVSAWHIDGPCSESRFERLADDVIETLRDGADAYGAVAWKLDDPTCPLIWPDDFTADVRERAAVFAMMIDLDWPPQPGSFARFATRWTVGRFSDN